MSGPLCERSERGSLHAVLCEALTNTQALLARLEAGVHVPRSEQREVVRLLYGWPLIPIERHCCTMAAALASALPAALDKVAEVLDLPVRKDVQGAKLMRLMSRTFLVGRLFIHVRSSATDIFDNLPAGGTGSDSFTLAIAHREFDKIGTVHLDLVRERKPRFVPRDVVGEFAQILKLYNVREVQGDKFAGSFHADEWQRNGILFKPCDRTTSDNYLHALPMLLSGRARLLDNATLRMQLAGLERKVQTGGRETVTHAQVASAHDDVATSACGALVVAGDRLAFIRPSQWM
jgi:hypothetical protein